MPGWKPLSIGYHGDDGGIYVESGKMTYRNETFKDARIGLYIHQDLNFLEFTKGPALGDDSKSLCRIRPEHLLKKELYLCVGFRFAKDAIVRTFDYKGKRNLNEGSRIEDKYFLCPRNN